MKTNYNKIKPIDKLNKVISTLDMLFDEFEKKKPKKIKVNCSFCNSKDSVKAFSYKNCNYRKCKDCDSIFLSPRITKKWLDEYYKFMQKKFIFEIPDKQRQVRIERLMKPRWKLLFKRLRPFIKKLPINRYMEIGPGVGYFTEVAKANRFAKEYVLVEPDIHCQSQLKKLGKNIKVLSSILEKVNLKDSGKADIIFINSVIEHPFSIEVFFQKLSQLTKSKGIVVLVDMHCNGLDIRTLKEKAPNINVYSILQIGSIKGITSITNRNGFIMRDVFSVGEMDADIIYEHLKKLDSNHPLKGLENIIEKEEVRKDLQKLLSKHLMTGYNGYIFQKK